jgi:hypothetical protein
MSTAVFDDDIRDQEKHSMRCHLRSKNKSEEISSVASNTMQSISSITYFSTKQPKPRPYIHVKMCNAAASEPAGSPR